MYKLCGDIEDMDGVTLIHDVHAWTIASGSESFSARAHPASHAERPPFDFPQGERGKRAGLEPAPTGSRGGEEGAAGSKPG